MDAVAEGREDDVESDYGSEDDSIIIKRHPAPAAGSIIGKGGSTINEFQIQTGARIQLSRTNETFPEPPTVSSPSAAPRRRSSAHAHDPGSADGEGIVDGNPQVKVVIPNVSCGCIIGKGGATIRLTEDSGADIKLAADRISRVTDRVLTVPDHRHRTPRRRARRHGAHGRRQLRLRRAAVHAPHVNLPVGSRDRRLTTDAQEGNGGGRARLHHRRRAGQHIGAVLGKGGRTISEIQGERSADQGERSRGFRRGKIAR